MLIKIAPWIIAILLTSACTSDNEHFCARYQYVYDQLNDSELPSYGEMKHQLLLEISQKPKDHDQQKFMLFVLEDYHIGIKPEHQAAQTFCMDKKRWLYY